MDPQTSVMISTGIRLSDIITWICLIFGGGGVFTWVKLTLTRHHDILFYASGETRVITRDALKITQDGCLKARSVEQAHLEAELLRIDIWNGKQVLALTSSIEKLSKKMDAMSTSITVLSVGGRPKIAEADVD